MTNTTTEYLQFFDEYKKKYGNKTICLYQCGSFFEVYSTGENIVPIHEYSNLLNIVCTRKDKSIKEISIKNPYMLGFPCVSKDKYIKILINAGYIVVIIEQQITKNMKIERNVTSIYSMGTYLDNISQDNNNMMAIYIEDEKQINGKLLTCIGISIIDLSTGICYIHETHSIMNDTFLSLDETKRILNSFLPREIILIHKKKNQIGELTKNDIMIHLEIENKNVQYYDIIEKEYYKISYQNTFLSKIYENKFETMLCPLEYLNIDKLIYGTLSFIFLLNYAYKQNNKIIYNLNIPKLIENEKYLTLGNNATLQLNIIESDIYDFPNGTKYKSIFDVINNTSTSIGRRYLKRRLLMPLTDVNELRNSYNNIEEFIKDKIYLIIENILKEISDIERLYRKIILKTIHPHELYNFIYSYKKLEELILFLYNKENIKKTCPKEEYIKSLKLFINEMENVFNMDELSKQSLNDISNSFFNNNVYQEIDVLQDKINNGLSSVDELCIILSSYIDESNKKKSLKIINNKLQIKKNEKEGYYFSLTKIRAKLLKEKLINMDKIKIGNDYIDPNDFIFKELDKGNTKIFFPKIEMNSDAILKIKEDMMKLVIINYNEILENIKIKYGNLFIQMSIFLENIDFYKSGAKTAIMYNYCKPVISEKNYGYVKCKKLRHPLIERLIENKGLAYICHDIDIGNDIKGILLYSLNGGGKSSLMKSLGISVIMAQAGLYVSAMEYELSPYKSLYARITSNDNMFQNMSSFGVEMNELKNILNRCNNPYSLCIGDEISKGTEAVSGSALVAAAIIHLSNANVSFVFSTHLHNIVNMKQIKSLTNVKAFHLSVEYDNINDILIYDRQLKEGSGPDDYGLMVAKYMLNDNKFIEMATEIKNELMMKSNNFLSMDTSRYNKKIYLDKCQICKKEYIKNQDVSNLETHHINYQMNCSENGFININNKQHIKKNSIYNLIVICKQCHDKIHNNKISINGIKETSKGKKIIINDTYESI